MKRCPTCNRTYPDDTLAFCLIDGSVLSAPFDGETKQPYTSRASAPPPTEILHASPPRAETNPTPRLQPTMQTYQPAPTPTQPAHKSNAAIWIALGSGVLVLLLIAVVAIVLVGRNLITNTNKNQNAVPANQASTENENSRPAATPESSPSPGRLNIVGHWVGTNDGTPATLVIDESDTDSYNGTEYVAESTPVK